jgi:DNA-binding HxlR family transcriptional regulator
MLKYTVDLTSIRDPKALRDELRIALATITGKWKLEILWLLNQRVHRFGELRRAIPEVTQHMLTAQLRELEADGLVSRKVFAEVPPKVEYSITERASALKPVLDAILSWSREQHAIK